MPATPGSFAHSALQSRLLGKQGCEHVWPGSWVGFCRSPCSVAPWSPISTVTDGQDSGSEQAVLGQALVESDIQQAFICPGSALQSQGLRS